ncbi:type II toxin-antitoxin system prevent-host-death family antitoxin, partial [bacterium]
KTDAARLALISPQNIQPASELATRATDLLREVRETRSPVVLTQEGRRVVVLVDLETYEDLLEEIELLQDVHLGLADAEAGRVVPHEEARARLLARYE